jgi:hypothetical protein
LRFVLKFKKLAILLILSVFFNISATEITETQKNYNISINGVYYSPEFLAMQPTGGTSLIFNYKSFRTSFCYTGTNYWDQKLHLFQSNIGGQYDFIKSEKMDAIIFGEFNFNIITGTFHKFDWPDDESPFYDNTFLFVSTSLGFEYSVGIKNLKFNVGSKFYLPVFLIFELEEDPHANAGFWLPGIEVYLGLKF